MSRVFAELYIDEDVDVLIAEFLRARGFTVLTRVEAGQLGASDVRQMAFAVERALAVVTHNRADFVRLHEQSLARGHQHSGIIVASRRPPRGVATRLLAILDKLTADEIHGQLIFV